MISFVNKPFVDRRIYPYKGSWLKPLEESPVTIYYFISAARTMVAEYNGNKEQLKETLSITVFGGKQFSKDDIIILDTGERFRISNITINFIEDNPLVKDMLKPRVANMVLVLE